MKFLQPYFDDTLSLEEINTCYKKYEDYLETIQSHFDIETYKILSSGELHDSEVMSINLLSSHNDNPSQFTVSLETEEYQYTCIYHDLKSVSLYNDFNELDGFDDILITECLFENSKFIHEIVFVGEQSWIIQCDKIKISRLEKR